MFSTVTTGQTEFTIDGAKCRDEDFEVKLENFISEASPDSVYVASNGLWKASEE